MSKEQGGLVRAGDLLAEVSITAPEQSQPSKPVQKHIEGLGRAIERREAEKIIQLPLWYEEERGTPNSFLRSALFAAIQGKDRKFLKEVTLASSKGYHRQVHRRTTKPGGFERLGNPRAYWAPASSRQYLPVHGLWVA